ncbi:MAG: hypothetical protein K9M80_01840 [Candidatus Marinimicrobia bacterium]|nr:hypothetical protein [Candidatus Neomarinimicrobiota bacterium]
MLYYDKEKGEVRVVDAYENHKAVKELWSKDKTRKKTYFKKVITYAYYMFNKKDGYTDIEDYWDRHKEVIQGFFIFDPEEDREIYEKQSLKDFCNAYKRHEWVQEEYDYERLAQKIQSMINYIIEFDNKIQLNVEFDVPYSFEDQNGETHEGVKKIRKKVEHIDTNQVTKLTKSLSDLYEQKEKLKNQMIRSKFNKSGDVGRAMFDRTDITI